jgi:hypothetical protein
MGDLDKQEVVAMVVAAVVIVAVIESWHRNQN